MTTTDSFRDLIADMFKVSVVVLVFFAFCVLFVASNKHRNEIDALQARVAALEREKGK